MSPWNGSIYHITYPSIYYCLKVTPKTLLGRSDGLVLVFLCLFVGVYANVKSIWLDMAFKLYFMSGTWLMLNTHTFCRVFLMGFGYYYLVNLMFTRKFSCLKLTTCVPARTGGVVAVDGAKTTQTTPNSDSMVCEMRTRQDLCRRHNLC